MMNERKLEKLADELGEEADEYLLVAEGPEVVWTSSREPDMDEARLLALYIASTSKEHGVPVESVVRDVLDNLGYDL